MDRKAVAIAAADMVDYATMLEHDEPGTLAALSVLRETYIQPCLGSGRIFRLLGDGSLFEFATAREAVNFAIALQERLRDVPLRTAGGDRIVLRIGIDCGEIIRDECDLHGEAINVANRLENLAPPGGVSVSEATYGALDQLSAREFAPIGQRQLKGVTRPVSVWRWPGTDENRPLAPPQSISANGRQILDPKVTELLLMLHMRSARLAVADAIDELLSEPDEGRGIPQDELYARIGARLNAARDLLSCVGIRCIDDIDAHMRSEPETAMSTYMANVFDNARTAYVFPILNEIGSIMQRPDNSVVRRLAIMAVVDRFMRETMLPRTRQLIKFAFVAA